MEPPAKPAKPSIKLPGVDTVLGFLDCAEPAGAPRCFAAIVVIWRMTCVAVPCMEVCIPPVERMKGASVSLVLTYPEIIEVFGNHNIPGRTESRAFLGWFLEHFFRLEESDAQDAICDGYDDKGVDGVFVDRNLERLTIFQTKLVQSEKRTLGDTALKEFVGTIGQFQTKALVQHIIDTTGNIELRELLKECDAPTLVEQGYAVHGVFVTNVDADKNAYHFAQTRGDITVFDGAALRSEWVPPGVSTPVHGTVELSLAGHAAIEYKTPDATVFIAPLLASDLIKLDGIQSTELFDWNVRKSLGKTKVNKAIATSIATQDEHKNFVLYHNGLTVLAETAEVSENEKLVIDGYTVVNGCQSLTTFFENKTKITDELRVVTRVIKLSPQSELAAKITRHSNNQNAISARDLQSNSAIQRRLQTEFQSAFDGKVHYEIKRGESAASSATVITNEEAARMLLAFDVKQPWACHQSYRLFDDLHSEIFGRPEVNAHRIVALDVLREAVVESLASIEDRLIASYRLTRYFFLYLLREAIESDTLGGTFIESPKTILSEIGAEGLKHVACQVLADLVIDFNAEVDERRDNEDPLDYKREFKSPKAVKHLTLSILANYAKGVKRGKSVSFMGEVAEIRVSAAG